MYEGLGFWRAWVLLRNPGTVSTLSGPEVEARGRKGVEEKSFILQESL